MLNELSHYNRSVLDEMVCFVGYSTHLLFFKCKQPIAPYIRSKRKVYIARLAQSDRASDSYECLKKAI